MKQTGIFEGRAEVLYNYGRFGWTRNYGKTWHGGIDIVGLDSDKIRMPYYDGKKITGTVTRARIVTNRADKTWEWGWYVCVQLDAGQTPDTVNFLYFCHCAKLLVSVGQKISSGDALGIMGNTGNAAGGYEHCHFEVRATATGTGVDPTAYAGISNAVGVYGTAGDGQTEQISETPRLAAAALPLSQSSTMQTAQATTSHPSQPNAAVNAPQTAAMAAFAAKKVLLLFSISLPSISPHTGPNICCLSSSPRPRPAGRSSPRRRC